MVIRLSRLRGRALQNTVAKNLTIRMPWDQVRRAAVVGCRRQLAALMKQRPERYGNDGTDSWSGHIEAAGSELITAVELDLPWVDFLDILRPSGGDKPPDVGDWIDVKHTVYATGRLPVHPDCPDDRAQVLVTGIMPVLTIRGWMWTHIAKQHRDEWWDEPRPNRPAIFAPQAELFEFDNLRELVESRRSHESSLASDSGS